ncbi:hypothetical protein HN51_071152 [Arachis hypogaea]
MRGPSEASRRDCDALEIGAPSLLGPTLIGAADGGGGRLVCVDAGVAGRGSPSLVVFSTSRVAHRRSSITGRLLCFVLAYRRWSSSLLRGWIMNYALLIMNSALLLNFVGFFCSVLQIIKAVVC